MNAVVLAIGLMLLLSVMRINVIIALTVSSMIAGLLSHMDFSDTIAIFNQGLGKGILKALTKSINPHSRSLYH